MPRSAVCDRESLSSHREHDTCRGTLWINIKLNPFHARTRDSPSINMPICGTTSCGSTTADLKCARCQGVFYCNAACQHADWRRHKPFCKSLPSSNTALGSSSLQRGRVSTSEVDTQLLLAVATLVENAAAQPKLLQKELSCALQRSKPLLARGARPDVFTRVPSNAAARSGSKLIVHVDRSCLSIACAFGKPGMEPLLELLLAADCKPALDSMLLGNLHLALGSLLHPSIMQLEGIYRRSSGCW